MYLFPGLVDAEKSPWQLVVFTDMVKYRPREIGLQGFQLDGSLEVEQSGLRLRNTSRTWGKLLMS